MFGRYRSAVQKVQRWHRELSRIHCAFASTKDFASIKIQAWFRGQASRLRFRKTVEGFTAVQVRGRQCCPKANDYVIAYQGLFRVGFARARIKVRRKQREKQHASNREHQALRDLVGEMQAELQAKAEITVRLTCGGCDV